MIKRLSMKPSEAFTLIEVLLTLSIAGVILVLAYSLFHSANTTLRGQRDRNQIDRAVHEVFLQLERDLMNAVPAQGYPEREFTLTHVSETVTELEFATLERIPGEPEAKWAELVLIRYAVDPEGALIRERRFHLGPAEPQREILLRQCGLFRIRPTAKVPGGTGDVDIPEGGVPGGVECTVAHAESLKHPLTARILIPAGQTLRRNPDNLQLDPSPSR